MLKLRILTFLAIILLFVIVFHLDLIRYFNMEFFLSEKNKLLSLYQDSPVFFILTYFCIYVFCATFSIPGAALLSLVSGFLFGFFIGSAVVSLGSATGAVCSFLISRFLMKNFVQKKFASRLKTINEGLKKNGAFYLFSLRLIPVFPFFLINILMGVTPISTKQFVIGSFLGMLPGTFVFVNAGRQLAHISSIHQIFSVKVILSFILLALLPWIFKWLIKIGKKLQMKYKK
ncbi:MAG: TVP38/TMEM64 family protein [Oligoflexia bacterium]|nr:TVP38/TMEM64 family protein [Oligoflexia bacterium]